MFRPDAAAPPAADRRRLVAQQGGHGSHRLGQDALTGLPNRTLLHDRTGQAIRQSDRELSPAALLLIDLDQSKEVNDTVGHHYGDQLLVQVGQRLQGRSASWTPWPGSAATSTCCRTVTPPGE